MESEPEDLDEIHTEQQQLNSQQQELLLRLQQQHHQHPIEVTTKLSPRLPQQIR